MFDDVYDEFEDEDGEDEFVEFENVHQIASTPKAGLYLIEGKKYWIPWKFVGQGSIDEDGDVGTVYLIEWIVNEKGIPH